MSGIWNINSTYNVNNKKISAKISFQVGEKFSARVVQLNRSTGEIFLKLLDGWQFSGELENFQNIMENQLIRLEVEGFENGKLKLRIVKSEGENGSESEDPINLFIKENNFDLTDADYDLVDEMVKHEIPLTKDNISNIKSTLEFMDKIKQNPEEQDAFIQEYLAGKNISPDSEEGKFVNTTLKKFFNQLKNIDSSDLFTFLENNIELNGDNIKSFNNVFKNYGTIYREIKTMGQLLPKHIVQQNVQPQGGSSENDIVKNQPAVQLADSSPENVPESQPTVQVRDIYKNISYGLKGEQQEIQQGGKSSESGKTDILKTIDDAQKSLGIPDGSKPEDITAGDSGNNILTSFVKNKIMPHISYKGIILTQEDIAQIAGQIKDQINLRTNDMKEIIKGILEQKNSGEKDTAENINHILNNNMNDFKIFNTISNSYYYMDLPINLNQKDYKCRLMIRDDRKRGKKIDSTNVKIAASISTENLGMVDAYLSVYNRSMNVDIRCNKKWLDLLSREQKKILDSLSDVGYNVDVKFHERVEEMNISTCREFFEDNEIGIINTRV
ncbi:MAG TPA: hypothetical protein DC034_05695 [Clostridium sp.]|nr:hypothetical protein [Clostridiales bacterium]HBC96273.1 hypothetical protein [Clostridium sp.]